MKRAWVVVLISIAVVLTGWAAYRAWGQAQEAAAPSMARFMPQGAVLFLETKDFRAMLQDWSAAPEKQAWLKSDNYEVFSRSRLLLRLQQIQSEFATAAGVPPDARFLGEVAGQQTALALYDIGKMEMLYITHLPDARAMQSALWQQRSQFEPRDVAGMKFFVRKEPQTGRAVAFAVQDDRLILGTREDLVAGALSLLAGQKLVTLEGQSWFADAIKAGKKAGDPRMVIHLAEVTRAPQFRTYWIQQNITELRRYESALVDLHRSSQEYREERILLPKGDASAGMSGNAQEVADLLRLVPPEAAFYEAAAAPATERVVANLEQKVLAEPRRIVVQSQIAPAAALGGAGVPGDASLEVRIDTPPALDTDVNREDPLVAVLARNNPRAVLVLHRSIAAGDGVFVRLGSAVVLSGGTDWDEQAVRTAVQQVVASGLTTGQMGTSWKNAGTGQNSYQELDGLMPVAMAIRRNYLIVSNDSAMLASVLARMGERVVAEPAVYAAGFNHAAERENFYRLTTLVDRPSRGSYAGSPAPPQFFSENVASLSKVFQRVKSQTVLVQREGPIEKQTVRYEWQQ